MHEQEPAEGQVERRAGGSLELEEIGRDLLELSATVAAEVLQRFGAERAVDLDTGDPALRSHAIGHQPHHRARA
jgi:hypothetical protein